ncbi:immunoglobulin-like domain-containing protein [Salinicoccus sesuvii]|uniref:Immunoglobulin-like domain-containing protein n=1 Tax=Salinicoccus sesuvii TaxID=868281 RepID=A0ABV7N5W6_9STAP
MNSSTVIKIMAGLLPAAPITGELLDAQIGESQLTDNDSESSSNSRYADYEGPTMEDEIANHSGNVPDLRGTEVYNVQVGDNFDPLAGVYAIDSQDGDITDNIEVTSNTVNTNRPGSYTVGYRVENSRNGWFEYTRSIEVSNAPTDPVPMIPPAEAELEDDSDDETSESAITFIGLDDITIEQGETFNPKEDVEIIDVDGSDITHRAYISGEVDTNSPGEYTIAYAVFDHFGDPHAKARTVIVE